MAYLYYICTEGTEETEVALSLKDTVKQMAHKGEALSL